MCDDDRILIAGDMVLPSISTNVSVYDVEPEANPLGRYLDSIDRLGALPADTLVLPSHGLPFFGLRQRVSQLHAHHRVRLEAALEACATPRTAHELMPDSRFELFPGAGHFPFNDDPERFVDPDPNLGAFHPLVRQRVRLRDRP